MTGFNPWQQALYGLSSGLMAAGAPGGFRNFGAGVGQGVGQFQDQQSRLVREQMLQKQFERDEADAAAKQAATEAEKKRIAALSTNVGGLLATYDDDDTSNDAFGALSPAQLSLARVQLESNPEGLLTQIGDWTKGSEPVKGVEIGGLLVNPITGEPIADFTENVKDVKRAGADNTSVNVNLPKSLEAGDKKEMELGAEAYTQAQEILPLFGIAREAAKNFNQSGPLGGAALVTERLKNYFGLPNNAGAGEVLQGMQTRLGTLLRIPGSGATSNYEMALYMQGVPGLLNSKPGNIALANIGEKLIKRRMENYTALKKYVLQNNTTVGFVPNDEPVLGAEDMAILQSGSPAPSPAPTVQGQTPAPAGAPDYSTMSDEELLKSLGIAP